MGLVDRGEGRRLNGGKRHHLVDHRPSCRPRRGGGLLRAFGLGDLLGLFGDISIYFSSQNALHVTPRANAAIDSRFMNGNRQVTPKPTLPAKLGRSECMVRPLAGLSPRGASRDRGHHPCKRLFQKSSATTAKWVCQGTATATRKVVPPLPSG